MDDLKSQLKYFCEKVDKELFQNIVPFWLTKTKDQNYGGFYGRISNDLQIEKNAPKSLILHTRILWAFAFLYNFKKDAGFLELANHAYTFIVDHFFDKEYRGLFWLVDHKGRVLQDHKKMYGQAFTIYALAEYYKITKQEKILEQAKEIFQLIEISNFDRVHGGYYEASSRDWQIDTTIALSEVDLNEVKSMNTHLHLMEAYTNLYRIWPDAFLKKQLLGLIHNHLDYIIDAQTKHLKLFFAEDWQGRSGTISFGHDIEGSWLLCEAAQILNDAVLKQKIEKLAVQIADVTIAQGFDNKHAIYAEKDVNGILHTHTDWWQQAEAVVGFINAWQITGNDNYLQWTLRCWDVIDKYIIDKKNGEWFYAIDSAGSVDKTRYKVSEWKGPYHNVRACVEVLTRLEKFIK